MSISFPLVLPYFAPTDRLPAALPTISQITSSKHVLSSQRGQRFVVRVGHYFVVKYGADIDTIEGENMLFVRQSCNIEVPEVYAIFNDEKNVPYIIMQYVSGQSLISMWQNLNQDQKATIIEKLRINLDAMRQIPTLQYYGKLGRRPYYDRIFRSLQPELQERVSGPFSDESQLIEVIALRYTETPFPCRGEYFGRVLPSVLRGHPPTFTHGDLQRKNIIIRPDGSPVIIDWESAAFYPRYYEYYTAMTAFGYYQDDWHFWVGKMLDEYVSELGWLETIGRELLIF